MNGLPSSGETQELIRRATLTVHYGDSLAVECTSFVHSFLQCIVGFNECTQGNIHYGFEHHFKNGCPLKSCTVRV